MQLLACKSFAPHPQQLSTPPITPSPPKKKKTTIKSVQRFLNHLFQNKCLFFLLPPVFQRISQPTGQDQQNDNSASYCPSLSGLISRIHLYIFLYLRCFYIFLYDDSGDVV